MRILDLNLLPIYKFFSQQCRVGSQSWHCVTCDKQAKLLTKTGDWFYANRSTTSPTEAAAKSVRAIIEEKTIVVATTNAEDEESDDVTAMDQDGSNMHLERSHAPYMPVTQGAKMYDLVSRALKKDHEYVASAIDEVPNM